MVMGRTHSMSGAGFWLAVGPGGLGWITTGSVPVAVLGAAVCAGAALAPDFDCPGSMSTKDGSTAVRAFGPLGEVIGHATDALSLFVYNLTRTAKDGDRESGHRTLTHTFAFALAMAGLVSAGSSLPGGFNAAGRHWSLGVLFTLTVLWASLHLALFGLADGWVKRLRRNHGLLAVMAASALGTAAVALALPPDRGAYPWLGLAVGAGFLIHDLGDAITRMGVPVLWPIKHRGKRWWEYRIPLALAIRAGGRAEALAVFPATVLVTVMLAAQTASPGLWSAAWDALTR